MYQVFSDYILDLNKIHDENCNAVILTRCFPSIRMIEEDISRLSYDFWFKNKEISFNTGSANDIYKAITSTYKTEMLQRTLSELVTDVTDIFAHFKDLFKVENINFKAEKIINNSCKLFHVDSVHVRAFITYYGFGTEFLNEGNINALGKTPWDGKCTPEEKNLKLTIDPRRVTRIFPGDLILMKGTKWTNKGNFFSPLYHKSPEISNLNPYRFIVSMDF
jgi:hypothetical protein